MSESTQVLLFPLIIGITHVFSIINICQVPWMLLEHEAVRPSAQTLSEGPGKYQCNETNMCDHYSCIILPEFNLNRTENIP